MRGRREVRSTLWASQGVTITNLAVASTAVLILAPGALLQAYRPYTIIRTVGFFGIRTDQVSADESFDCAIGQCVVQDEAAAIGVTAVPTPFTDLDSDAWFQHQILMGRFDTLSQIGYQPNMLVSTQIESKAMRKVEEGQSQIVVVENSSLSLGVTVHHAGRFLIKLH